MPGVKKVRRLPSAAVKNIRFVVRIALGGIFLISCAGKIADPAAFAAIVSNYQLLSPPMVTATAVVFPWIEALCGVALVFGRLEKGASMLVCLMMIVLTGLLFYNAYRGLNIACGCFSLSANAPSNVAVNTTRNLFILATGAWILFFPKGPRPAAAR
jgi:uncharacterized membrane protein YphA (DoxX/SURF4 family)